MHNKHKTHCLRGHELIGVNIYMTPTGRRQCRLCINERAKQRRRERGQLVLEGDVSLRRTKAIKSWITRRERYGEKGLSDTGYKKLKESAPKTNQHTYQRRCKRGHSLTDAYTYNRNGRRQRQCRVCSMLRTVQNRQIRKLQRLLPEARAKMIHWGVKSNQHPESAYYKKCYMDAMTRWRRLRDGKAHVV